MRRPQRPCLASNADGFERRLRTLISSKQLLISFAAPLLPHLLHPFSYKQPLISALHGIPLKASARFCLSTNQMARCNSHVVLRGFLIGQSGRHVGSGWFGGGSRCALSGSHQTVPRWPFAAGQVGSRDCGRRIGSCLLTNEGNDWSVPVT